MYDFYYDPVRQGYDTTLWKSLSGTPAASGDNLRLTSAEMINYGDLKGGHHTFRVNVPTVSNAVLEGGTSATTTISTWTAVSDGEFTISVDGTSYDITGIDFSGASNMDEIATIIEAAVQAQAQDYVTVTWDTDHFVITGRESLTKTSAVPSGTGTDISGVATTAFMDADDGAADETLTDGTSKVFGLYAHNLGHKATFEIRGEKLVIVTKGEKGETETMIDWDSSWEGSMFDYEINIIGWQVVFKIDGKTKACHDDDNYPDGALSWYVYNPDSDNLDIAYLEARSVEGYV